jgi:protein TonB
MSIHAPRWRPSPESASKTTLPAGNTSPQFASPRFGSSFHDNLREWFRPAPLRRRASADSSRKDPGRRASQVIALAVHAGVVILIFSPLGRLPSGAGRPARETHVTPLDFGELPHKLPPGNNLARGGGGGGDHSPRPTTIGRLPKFMTAQFAPPSIPRNPKPILVAEASLIGPPDLQLPSPDLNFYGDPLAKMVDDSSGPGRGGGMGNGQGTGIGPGQGPGFGPGRGGGAGGDSFEPGTNGVGFPICVYCPDARYSDDARKAKLQGVVELQVIVSADGRTADIRVVRGLGMGMEQQAVEAVKNWRFNPALGPNRKPVPTQVIIEVQFRLL